MACLMNYTVQCLDGTTGKNGCFLFNITHWQTTGEFLAISPVLPDLNSFFAWDNANGPLRKSSYIERT